MSKVMSSIQEGLAEVRNRYGRLVSIDYGYPVQDLNEGYVNDVSAVAAKNIIEQYTLQHRSKVKEIAEQMQTAAVLELRNKGHEKEANKLALHSFSDDDITNLSLEFLRED